MSIDGTFETCACNKVILSWPFLNTGAFLVTNVAAKVKDEEPSRLGIVGGHKASEGQFPYMVSFQLLKEGKDWPSHTHFCGGAIIDRRNVLTAAHCCEFPMNQSVI